MEKYFFYEDTILNVNQLIWIKQIGDRCIELLFENDVTWYVLSDPEKRLLNDFRLFLSNKSPFSTNIFDIKKISKSICLKKNENEEIEEEFSHFS